MWKQQTVKESILEFLWIKNKQKNLSQYLCPLRADVDLSARLPFYSPFSVKQVPNLVYSYLGMMFFQVTFCLLFTGSSTGRSFQVNFTDALSEYLASGCNLLLLRMCLFTTQLFVIVSFSLLALFFTHFLLTVAFFLFRSAALSLFPLYLNTLDYVSVVTITLLCGPTNSAVSRSLFSLSKRTCKNT